MSLSIVFISVFFLVNVTNTSFDLINVIYFVFYDNSNLYHTCLEPLKVGSRSSQCSTTGVTKVVVCVILSVG